MVFVSPNPTDAAFKDAFNVSVAAAPSNPADVIKNNASAASLALLPVSIAIFFAVSPNFLTSSPAIPTNDSICPIDLSKSNAIFVAAAPAAINGNVKRVDIDFPTLCILDPNACNFELAELNEFFNFDESPVILTFKFDSAINNDFSKNTKKKTLLF